MTGKQERKRQKTGKSSSLPAHMEGATRQQIEHMIQKERRLQSENDLRDELKILREENRRLISEKSALQCKVTEIAAFSKQQLIQKNTEIRRLKQKVKKYRKLVARNSHGAEVIPSSPDDKESSCWRELGESSSTAHSDPIHKLSQTLDQLTSPGHVHKESVTAECVEPKGEDVSKKPRATQNDLSCSKLEEKQKEKTKAQKSSNEKVSAVSCSARSVDTEDSDSGSEIELKRSKKSQRKEEIEPTQQCRRSSRLVRKTAAAGQSQSVNRLVARKTTVLSSSSSSDDSEGEKVSNKTPLKSQNSSQTRSGRTQVSLDSQSGQAKARDQANKRHSRAKKRFISTSSETSESEAKESGPSSAWDSDMPPLDVPDSRKRKVPREKRSLPSGTKRGKVENSDKSRKTKDRETLSDLHAKSQKVETDKPFLDASSEDEVRTADQSSEPDASAKFDETGTSQTATEQQKLTERSTVSVTASPAVCATPLRSSGENEAILGDLSSSSDELVINLSPAETSECCPSDKHTRSTASVNQTKCCPPDDKSGTNVIKTPSSTEKLSGRGEVSKTPKAKVSCVTGMKRNQKNKDDESENIVAESLEKCRNTRRCSEANGAVADKKTTKQATTKTRSDKRNRDASKTRSDKRNRDASKTISSTKEALKRQTSNVRLDSKKKTPKSETLRQTVEENKIRESKRDDTAAESSKMRQKAIAAGSSFVDEIISGSLQTVGPPKTTPNPSFRIPKKSRRSPPKTQNQVLPNTTVNPSKLLRKSPEKASRLQANFREKSLAPTASLLHLTGTCALSPAMVQLLPHPSVAPRLKGSASVSSHQPGSALAPEETQQNQDAVMKIISKWNDVAFSKNADEEDHVSLQVSSTSEAVRADVGANPMLLQEPGLEDARAGQHAGSEASKVSQEQGPDNTTVCQDLSHASGGSVLVHQEVVSTSLPAALTNLIKPTATSTTDANLPSTLASLIPPGLTKIPALLNQMTDASHVDVPSEDKLDPAASACLSLKKKSTDDAADVRTQKDLDASAQPAVSKPEQVDTAIKLQDCSHDKHTNTSRQQKDIGDSKNEMVPNANGESRVFWGHQGRKKPVVPPKKKGTYSGISDEERLAAYIGVGDKNNFEQKLTLKVHKNKKKTFERCGQPDNMLHNQNELLTDTASPQTEQGFVQQEFSEGSDPVMAKIKGDLLAQTALMNPDLNVKSNAATERVSTDKRHTEGQLEGADLTTSTEPAQFTGATARPMDNVDEQQQQTSCVSAVKSPVQVGHDHSDTEQRHKCTDTHDPALKQASKPDIYQASHFSGQVLRNLPPIVSSLPKPHIRPDEMIPKIPLENCKNAADVAHHEFDLDPRVALRTVPGTESLYSAGFTFRAHVHLVMPHFSSDPDFPKSTVSTMSPAKWVDPNPGQDNLTSTSACPDSHEFLPSECAKHTDKLHGKASQLACVQKAEIDAQPSQQDAGSPHQLPAKTSSSSSSVDDSRTSQGEEEIGDSDETSCEAGASTSQESIASEAGRRPSGTDVSSRSTDSDVNTNIAQPIEHPGAGDELETGHITTVSIYANQSAAKPKSTERCASRPETTSLAATEPSRSLESVMMNAPHQSDFQVVVRSSAFALEESSDPHRVSPEPRWIDKSLIRRVESVHRPEPRRVVVALPVINAITTRHPLFRSPAKTKHRAADKQVQQHRLNQTNITKPENAQKIEERDTESKHETQREDVNGESVASQKIRKKAASETRDSTETSQESGTCRDGSVRRNETESGSMSTSQQVSEEDSSSNSGNSSAEDTDDTENTSEDSSSDAEAQSGSEDSTSDNGSESQSESGSESCSKSGSESEGAESTKGASRSDAESPQETKGASRSDAESPQKTKVTATACDAGQPNDPQGSVPRSRSLGISGRLSALLKAVESEPLCAEKEPKDHSRVEFLDGSEVGISLGRTQDFAVSPRLNNSQMDASNHFPDATATIQANHANENACLAGVPSFDAQDDGFQHERSEDDSSGCVERTGGNDEGSSVSLTHDHERAGQTQGDTNDPESEYDSAVEDSAQNVGRDEQSPSRAQRQSKDGQSDETGQQKVTSDATPRGSDIPPKSPNAEETGKKEGLFTNTACSDQEDDDAEEAETGEAENELSTEDFVSLDALDDDDSLFAGLDEKPSPVKNRSSRQEETMRMSLRSSPRKQPHRALKSSKSTKTSQREADFKQTLTQNNSLPRNEVAHKQNSESCSFVHEIRSQAGVVLPESSSLEEGEIVDDSQESSCEVRRSPRKHSSSHANSSARAPGVKRRLPSPSRPTKMPRYSLDSMALHRSRPGRRGRSRKQPSRSSLNLVAPASRSPRRPNLIGKRLGSNPRRRSRDCTAEANAGWPIKPRDIAKDRRPCTSTNSDFKSEKRERPIRSPPERKFRKGESEDKFRERTGDFVHRRKSVTARQHDEEATSRRRSRSHDRCEGSVGREPPSQRGSRSGSRHRGSRSASGEPTKNRSKFPRSDSKPNRVEMEALEQEAEIEPNGGSDAKTTKRCVLAAKSENNSTSGECHRAVHDMKSTSLRETNETRQTQVSSKDVSVDCDATKQTKPRVLAEEAEASQRTRDEQCTAKSDKMKRKEERKKKNCKSKTKLLENREDEQTGKKSKKKTTKN